MDKQYFEGDGIIGEFDHFYKTNQNGFEEVTKQEFLRSKITTLGEELVGDGFLKVYKATINHILPNEQVITYRRSKVEREDAVGVIIRNLDTKKYLFVIQYRYPVEQKTNPMMLEIVAGRMEKDQTPKQTAIREIEEEIGYSIREENIRHLVSYFSSPGYSSEKIHLFSADVRNDQKKSNGGGLATENEFINVEELSYEDIHKKYSKNEFLDGKTLMAIMLYFPEFNI